MNIDSLKKHRIIESPLYPSIYWLKVALLRVSRSLLLNVGSLKYTTLRLDHTIHVYSG